MEVIHASLLSKPTMAENQAPRQTNWKSCPAWNQGSEFSSPGTYTATGQDKTLSQPDTCLGAHKLPDICIHVRPRATKNKAFCRNSSALLGKADILGSTHLERVEGKQVVPWPVGLHPQHTLWGAVEAGGA